MARRIDIELTSARDDGSWTWRAAGARQPKGVVDAGVLPGTPAVGDVLRVEVEMGLDGTEITTVLPPKAGRSEPQRIEFLGRTLGDDELVTTRLVGKRGRDRDDDRRDRRGSRDRRGPGGGGERGRGPGGAGEKGRGGPRDGRPSGDGERRPPRGEGSARPRDDAKRPTGGANRTSERPRRRPPTDERPRPKRLRPQRTHRRALLDTLEVHERPIADEVLKGGIPAVRQAVERQNQQARAEGRPEVDPAQLEALAERLLPRLRVAEWRDRAEAALADIDELDLRDLRTVVVAADTGAKDDASRALAAQLREGLERRIEADQAAWLQELADLLAAGRVVRALRVSSRPPKAGAPLPADLSARLIAGAAASLTADTVPDRWITVIDALVLSPVHAKVAPESIPATVADELAQAVAANGLRVPLVAQALGIEPSAAPARRAPRRNVERRPPRPAAKGRGPAAPRPPKPADGPPGADPPAAPDQASSPADQGEEGGTVAAAPAAPPGDEPDAPAPETPGGDQPASDPVDPTPPPDLDTGFLAEQREEGGAVDPAPEAPDGQPEAGAGATGDDPGAAGSAGDETASPPPD